MRKVFIHAPGSGMGHVSRAIALGMALTHRGHQCHILASSQLARKHIPWDSIEPSNQTSVVAAHQFKGIRVDFLTAKISREALALQLRHFLHNFHYDFLIVDVFPRGILGEIPLLFRDLPSHIRTVWVQRLLSEAYLKHLEASPLPNYDLSFLPGESAGRFNPCISKQEIRTEPWITDCPTHSHNSRIASLEGENPNKILWVASGSTNESKNMFRLYQETQRVSQRSVTFDFTSPLTVGPQLKTWPLHSIFHQYDCIVGAPGYHLTHECIATRTPLIMIPMKRLYDDQVARCKLAMEKQSIHRRASPATIEKIISEPIPTCNKVIKNTTPSGVHTAVRTFERI